MTARIICSRKQERVWQTRPQWQHPSRREHIHNKVQGLPDRRDPTARVFVIGALLIAGFFAIQLMRWFV